MYFIKFFIKIFYYSFYDLFKIIVNLKKEFNFVIIYPRVISIIFKHVLILEKKKKKFFLQYIRNYSDILTVYEIFGEQDYNIDKFIHEKLKLKLGNSLFNNLIIDCGSNIGSSVEFFSRTYPNARIVGLEPEINNFKFSKKNISSEKHLILNNAICSEKKKIKT